MDMFALATLKCATCKKHKPADTDHYHSDKSKSRGFKSSCLTCQDERSEKRRAERKALPPKTGVCSGSCGEVKDRTEEFFNVSAGRLDGLNTECKICSRIRLKEHCDKMNVDWRDHYIEGEPKKCTGKCRQYKPADLAHYTPNPKRTDGMLSICLECNNALRRVREVARWKSDENWKFACIIKSRIRTSVKGNIKSGSSEELLGCDTDYARAHLASLFQDGMSWDNHSLHGWHMDHFKPIDSFDLSDPQEQRKCFNWRNLQPMWALDNLVKSNRWSDEDDAKWEEAIGRFIV